MKKKLVVLLAVVMMFAFSASAYAATFSDLSDQPTTVQDSVAKTVALGIIEGYSDGTFGPDQNITRSEFAKIAVTAAGAKETATILEGNASTFKDVKSGAWYTGWINAAESLGIFLGDGNGNFRPNDTITNQEVITVLLRLLGYNDNLTGTWPVNYVNQANKIEILDDVTITASAAAKRADVVVMLSATLDANLVTYDKDTNEFVNKQTTKGGQDEEEITLLKDSFKGKYVEYKIAADGTLNTMSAPNQVRDAADKTMNWTVDGKTLIVDSDTAVSSNVSDILAVSDQLGKIYYVQDGSKYYARFVEVKSYTKTVTDAPSVDGSKIKVGSTSYNAIATKLTEGGVTTTSVANDLTANAAAGNKNSNYTLYFNDDDQVYKVKSDMDKSGDSYFVKSVGTNTVRVVGNTEKTLNIKDSDTIIWTSEGFINPSALKVGDTIQTVGSNANLYKMVSSATGTLASTTSTKVKIGGSNFVIGGDIDSKLYDENYDGDTGVSIDDVYGNEVTYVLNKDNTVAAIIVGETSTGTKLYGIFVDTETNSTSLAGGQASSITIFTSEGKTVTYTINKDKKAKINDEVLQVSGGTSPILGLPVEYKVNKSGEVTSVAVFTRDMLNGASQTSAPDQEIEVDNNKYLKVTAGGTTTTYTLASNAIIFEVNDDNGDVDASVVTRASVLSGGDFTPGNIALTGSSINQDAANSNRGTFTYAYMVPTTTGGNTIKVLAYTNSSSNKYHYGVVDTYNFKGADYDNSITFNGDETVYELDRTGTPVASANGAFVVYTKSGDTVTIVSSFKDKDDFEAGVLISSVSDGLINFDSALEDVIDLDGNAVAAQNVPTNDSTLIYVLDASTGKFVEGTADSIVKNGYAYVPVLDDDGYATVVIVDEYNDYTVE
jgi:hypothetical protein